MAVVRRRPMYDEEFGVGADDAPSSPYQTPNTGASGPGTTPPPPDEPLPPGTSDLPPIVIPGRCGESPRERAGSGSGGGGTGSPGLTGGIAAPPRPRVPTPDAGASFTPPQGPMVSPPMGGPSPVDLSKPLGRRGLFGGAGGLTMGGLGVPFDPTGSDQSSDPISSLIKQLMGRSGSY